MHAMMSETATEGWGEVHRFVVPYRTTDLRADLARGAMDEARRVLAVAEPDALTALSVTTHHGNGGGMLGWPAGCVALAESLAAFVAADDPVAFLQARA